MGLGTVILYNGEYIAQIVGVDSNEPDLVTILIFNVSTKTTTETTVSRTLCEDFNK